MKFTMKLLRSLTTSALITLLCGTMPAHAAPVNEWVNTETAGISANRNDLVDVVENPMQQQHRMHHRIPIAVTLKLRNQPMLDALTNQILANPSARQLSRNEFMRMHAPSSNDAGKVMHYLRTMGFSDVSISKNRILITAEGPIIAVESAFNTKIQFFIKNGQSVFAHVGAAQVPAHLSHSILAISGLQTASMSAPPPRQLNGLKNTPLIQNNALHPSEYAKIYRADRLPPAATAAIGLITQGRITQTINDLSGFAAHSGFPMPRITINTIGAGTSDSSNLVEWNLLSQVMLAAAGGRVGEFMFYNVGRFSDVNLLDAINRAIIDHRARVITMSFGLCETDAFASGYAAAANALFQAGVAQGQTFVAAMGNSDTLDCHHRIKGQSYPAVSPFVIAVGGTSLTASAAESAALPHLGEAVWPATSGGVSRTQFAPDWQRQSGVFREQFRHKPSPLAQSRASNDRRGVPDLAFNADPDSGARILVMGHDDRVGGTGLAAALFSGFWARIQAAHHHHLPFPAALLYVHAKKNPHWFFDVQSGDNGITQAAPGWDYVSGFGSLHIHHFSNGIRQLQQDNAQADTAPLLINTIPLTGISISQGNTALYRMQVPKQTSTSGSTPSSRRQTGTGKIDSSRESTSLHFRLSGLAGSPAGNGTNNRAGDMLVHIGATPTTRSYLKRGSRLNDEETIIIDNPLSGMYHVLIHASENINNATLVANYQGPLPETTLLSRKTPVKQRRLAPGENIIYAISIPEGAVNLRFRLSGGRGDADLYTRFNKPPTMSLYDARSDGYTNEELITISQPEAGVHYVMVVAFKGSRKTVLKTDYDE